MVDVETGDEPRPMRTLDEEPPAGPPERPRPGVLNGRAVKRPSSKPAPAGTPPRHMPKLSARQAPRSVPSSSRIAETDWSPATFGTDELLWLDGPSGDTGASSGDGSTTKTCEQAGVSGCPENGEW